MSPSSTFFAMPYIQGNQAQKHVTHNEALRILDNLLHVSVLNCTTVHPPENPAVKDRYIVAPTATGAWAGHDHAIAVWDNNTWLFYAPDIGALIWDQGDGAIKVRTSTGWVTALPPSDTQNLDHLGIQTTADTTNRLAVASPASLFTHDNTTGDHRFVINKASAPNTASMVLQSNWVGHAEIGLMGTTDFAIKTSLDGAAFKTALTADAQTGAVSFPSGVVGLSPAAFDQGDQVTTSYLDAAVGARFTNGGLYLSNSYNYPTELDFAPESISHLPGAVSWTGRYPGLIRSQEYIPVDSNQCYEIGCYLLQDPVSGDWGDYDHEDRHQQMIGFACYDRDYNQILSYHHMRHFHDGTDSLTTLSAPLAPGDTVVHVTDASGWNETKTSSKNRGIIIFGYQNSAGQSYDYYSRLRGSGMFDLSGVDKDSNTITLNTGLSSNFANPKDPNGVWPAGTPIANAASGTNHKYALMYYDRVLPTSGDWYLAQNHIGGGDHSGQNIMTNFAPGTVYIKMVWLPNYTNRSGTGLYGHPDTGPDHKVYMSGMSIERDRTTVLQRHSAGHVEIFRPQADPASGTVTVVATTERRSPLL